MSRRSTLADLRRTLPWELGDEWVTPSEICDRLGLDDGLDWYRVALVLERLANDGLIELKRPGRVRRFRRRRAAGE
jgi:hypothetical protein